MKNSKAPMLSVIVPVYNSSEQLKQCLSALSSSKCEDFEVLVVDDGSTQTLQPIVARHGFRYVRIDGPGGPARARNHGATIVSGKYLVFIDADVCVHEDTLQRFADAFTRDTSLNAVIGMYDDAPAEQSFLSQYKNLFHHYVHKANDGEVITFWSGCGAIRRDLFLDFGGFDEKRYARPSIEDIELGTWFSAAGHRIVLDSRIKAKHLKRWTMWGLIKTDIFDRGIPWTRLMLRAGSVANTLNVRPTQRLSVVLTYLTVLLALAGLLWPVSLAFAAALAAAVTLMNLDFYRYFFEQRGFWFTIRTVPMHWLYFLYCGFCVLAGTALHYIERARLSPAAPPVTKVNID
jgi:glycosyltransferase involved in cell wall biosynthesis